MQVRVSHPFPPDSGLDQSFRKEIRRLRRPDRGRRTASPTGRTLRWSFANRRRGQGHRAPDGAVTRRHPARPPCESATSGVHVLRLVLTSNGWTAGLRSRTTSTQTATFGSSERPDRMSWAVRGPRRASVVMSAASGGQHDLTFEVSVDPGGRHVLCAGSLRFDRRRRAAGSVPVGLLVLGKRKEARMLTDEHLAVNTMIDRGAALIRSRITSIRWRCLASS